MKTTNKVMMNEEELNMVNGGGWGYNTYHNEDEYKAAGVKTDWTSWFNPFQRDKFTFNGESIEGTTAAKIVFYARSTGLPSSKITVQDALNFAIANADAFKKDVEAANK